MKEKTFNERRCSRIFKIFLTLVLSISIVLAAGSNSEYEVKANYVTSFPGYIDWPSSALGSGDPIVIGIVGEDPFGDVIDRSAKAKNANGHSIVVKRVSGSAIHECSILYIGYEGSKASQIANSVKGEPIVTVSDADNFAQNGGMIGLVVVDNKVRFDINIKTAKAAKVAINSRLLKLAHSVIGN